MDRSVGGQLGPVEQTPGLWHRAWRRLPRAPRRRAALHLAALLAPRPDAVPPQAAPGLAVAGETDRASGLGEGARLMLRALALLGAPHAAPAPGRASLPPPAMPLVVHANAPALPAMLLRLDRGLPRRRRVIGYWAWDLPVVPPDWRPGLRFVHEIWVPSAFVADAMRPLADGRPVRVVPHPVAIRPPGVADRAACGFPPGVVVVLTAFSLASSCVRKNPSGTIRAFLAAFGARTDRLLVLKIAHAGHFPDDLAQLRAMAVGHANIRIDTRTLADEDMRVMTASADIVLCLHRSEGFGLVGAEAMLAGRAVVATGWSGNLQYMDADSAALVPARLVPARDPRGVFEAPGAVWAEPDEAAAAAALALLADDAEARARLGRAAALRCRAMLGTDALSAALDALAGSPPA